MTRQIHTFFNSLRRPSTDNPDYNTVLAVRPIYAKPFRRAIPVLLSILFLYTGFYIVFGIYVTVSDVYYDSITDPSEGVDWSTRNKGSIFAIWVITPLLLWTANLIECVRRRRRTMGEVSVVVVGAAGCVASILYFLFMSFSESESIGYARFYVPEIPMIVVYFIYMLFGVAALVKSKMQKRRTDRLTRPSIADHEAAFLEHAPAQPRPQRLERLPSYHSAAGSETVVIPAEKSDF